MQVLRVYARVASLVVVFLAMTGLLYFLLPAPIDPSTATTSVGSPRERSDVHNPPLSPATSPPSTASLSASSITPISSPTSSEACPLDQVMQPRASPLPSRGPPRLEHYRASIIVPVLSLNANIAANLARLLAFLNTTYHLSSPLPLPLSSPATTSWSSAGTLSPSSSSSTSTTTASKAAPTTEAVARAPTPTTQRLVEVLLVVDPMRLPIQSAAERATANATPYPSLGMAQQWDVYHLKRMLRDFQYELRVRDETFLRVITLSSNMSGDAASASSCYQSGGDVFGAACNLGAVRARGQWLFFLSAETYFEQGWFEEQLQALDGLQSAKGRASGRTSPDSADTGLIGCKILDGPTAARAHSAGFDVALSRRELLPAQAVPVASTSAPRAPPTTTTVKKRGRGSKLLAGSRTIDEWRELLTKQGSEELRKIMETMDTPRPDERDEDLEPEPEVAVSPPQTTQQSEPADGYKFKDVVFPYRRVEGVARADGRFNEPAEIIAPSSMCFIVDKRTFLNEAKGFRVQTASTQRSADGPRTPFLQVLDLSLRLRSSNNRRSLYLPTQKGVIRNKPEGAWNAEDDTTREDHGLCSSTLFPVAPAASPSPASALPWWMSSSAASGDSAASLLPQPLSVAERDFAQQWESELMRTVDARRQVDVELVWDSYGGCTGWGLEAVRFVTALEPLLSKVAIIASDQGSFCPGLPRNVLQSMRRARSRLDDASVPPARWNNDSVQVWMSHKPPVSYPTFPYKGTVTVTKRPDYVIGRSMTETTAMPAGWADNAKRVDEIWVPSSFLVEVFASGGVPREKLAVVPIPIDTQFYSPLPFLPSSSSSTASLPSQLRPLFLPNRGGFNFLSVFKWEQRKGWDVLLDAYLAEFKPEDNTTLYLQTYLPGSMGRDKSSFEWKVMERATALANNKATPAAQSFARPGASSLPRVEILCTEVPEQDMPRLYAAVDAFVLPTRGEGFGMPIMEAMSMGLPTIATNWSGQVDFMNERNAYPLRVEAMVSAEAPSLSSSSWTLDQTATKFAGEWAQPSVQHLRQLMRHVFTNREEAKRKGESARADIVAQFSQGKVAELVVERLKGVERVVRDRRRAL